jgi:hypothetical protein
VGRATKLPREDVARAVWFDVCTNNRVDVAQTLHEIFDLSPMGTSFLENGFWISGLPMMQWIAKTFGLPQRTRYRDFVVHRGVGHEVVQWLVSQFGPPEN